MRGVEIAYLLNNYFEGSYELIEDLYKKLKHYPVTFKHKTLYGNDETDYSLIMLGFYFDPEDGEEDEVTHVSFTSDDILDEIVDYVLKELHINENDKSDSSDEEGGEYDGWYGSD